MTNGDWIRQMSDEELAYLIMCPYDMVSGDLCLEPNIGCKECCLTWLKQEAEAAEND